MNRSETKGRTDSPWKHVTFLLLLSFLTLCFAGSAMLFLSAYILTWLRWWVCDQPRPQNYSNIILWKALVLSNCGQFLIIPSLIWGQIGTETHSIFIMGYTFLSQLKVYSGKCICVVHWICDMENCCVF